MKNNKYIDDYTSYRQRHDFEDVYVYDYIKFYITKKPVVEPHKYHISVKDSLGYTVIGIGLRTLEENQLLANRVIEYLNK